ncbi:MAG: hypothetical protein L0Y56_03885 [Nitrospira sp.]|nr:hypothetical protein [Nitrospira sp.]
MKSFLYRPSPRIHSPNLDDQVSEISLSCTQFLEYFFDEGVSDSLIAQAAIRGVAIHVGATTLEDCDEKMICKTLCEILVESLRKGFLIREQLEMARRLKGRIPDGGNSGPTLQ